METRLKTAHEEQYSDGSRTLGVLLNYDVNSDWKESLVYIFTEKTKIYTFFNTIIDMIDFSMYEDKKIHRAYMEEKEFDQYYDATIIDGIFAEKLKWL